MSIFTQTPVRNIPSNSFDLTHDVKMSLDAGFLVPIVCTEILPGDTLNYKNVLMARLAPMVTPPMHKIDITTSAFFVPLRLVWENSQNFFANPVPDPTTPVAPFFANVPIGVGSLGDYLGLPTQYYNNGANPTHPQYTALEKFSALPFACYQKIYNDYYRDQNNVVGTLPDGNYPDQLVDGQNNFSDFNVLRRRAWQHDYFTSALPFAQKGQPVSLPVAGTAPVVLDNPTPANTVKWEGLAGGQSGNLQVQNPNSDIWAGTAGIAANRGHIDPNGSLSADLSHISAMDVNTLRWALRLQEFLEKNARGGTRYIELMRQHFGQRSSDARLQRAEFIHSSTQPIVISEVLQTSASEAGSTPQGEMTGHGLSVGSSPYCKYHAEEHGFFIVLASIRPKTAYSQGIPKMWSRFSPLDYAWPTFAHLGEQEVENQEVFVDNDITQNHNTFGYVPRYAEYRYENSRIAGEFRTSLAHWHMSRLFVNRPHLNHQFINCEPTKRIFAVNSPAVHSYYMHVSNMLRIRRKLPKFGIPSI